MDAPLPRVPDSVHVEQAALDAFRSAISSVERFSVHQETRDLGTDMQIAPLLPSDAGQFATNFRVHVQIKGTKSEANQDGSVSLEFSSSNLHYLFGQPYSQLVLFHVPTGTLFASSVERVVRSLEHQGKSLGTQATVTVRFRHSFDEAYQGRLHSLVVAHGTRSVNDRHGWLTTPPEEIGRRYRGSVRSFSLPDDPAAAHQVVSSLLKEGEDLAISTHFEEYRAICGATKELLVPAYLAEVNLGLTGLEPDLDRIREGAVILMQTEDRWEAPCVYWYTIGNTLNVLGEKDRARSAYLNACVLADEQYAEIEAQACVNMANLLKSEGETQVAAAMLERALDLRPALWEAHAALGRIRLLHESRPEDAAASFARALENDPLNHHVAGLRFWRARALLEVGRIDDGFSEVRQGLSTGKDQEWVWPHLVYILSTFGTRSADAARHALSLWDRYLERHPAPAARLRRLMCVLKLDLESVRELPGYGGFQGDEVAAEVDALLADEDSPDRIARAHDQLGHWHQRMRNWTNAERRFRLAWEHDPDTYGQCLGMSLVFLKRFAEAATVLGDYVEVHPEDERGWFQLGVAQLEMRKLDPAIASFRKAIEIEPDYTHAWANLIGAVDLSGRSGEAWETCEEGLHRFGEHQHIVEARRQLLYPQFLLDDPGEPPPLP